MVLDTLKENETVAWAVDKFLKVGLIGFLSLSVILLLKAVLGLEFDFSMGLGI